MSGIGDLLKELCPKGVPYKLIGDVATVGTGSSDRKDATEDGEYPFYVRSKEIRRKDSYEFDEEAVLIPGEGSIGEIFHYVNGKYALHQRAYRISFKTPDIDAKFAYYYFQTSFKKFILAKAVNATVTSIRKPMITDFKIPVPPVEVQREIVQLLDQYGELATGLTVQLQAEFEARQQQYAYYRNDLFAFRGIEDVRRVPIGGLGEIFRGKRFTKADYVPQGGAACIHYGEIYTDYGTAATHTVSRVRAELARSLRFAHKGDVVLTDVGETVEDVGKAVAWLGNEDAAIHDHCYVIRSSVNPVYLSYYMQTAAFRADKDRYIARTKVKTLLLDGLKRIVVPVPSQDEQERIVSVLDKLKAPIADLSVALHAEINARRKQYEYYRDHLLTFEELTA